MCSYYLAICKLKSDRSKHIIAKCQLPAGAYCTVQTRYSLSIASYACPHRTQLASRPAGSYASTDAEQISDVFCGETAPNWANAAAEAGVATASFIIREGGSFGASFRWWPSVRYVTYMSVCGLVHYIQACCTCVAQFTIANFFFSSAVLILLLVHWTAWPAASHSRNVGRRSIYH